jgi:hypothetical protein
VGQLAKMLGQQGLQLFPQQARQNRRCPRTRDATISGERSMIDGMIKLASFGASTTLQKIRRASQASLTRWSLHRHPSRRSASQQVSSRDH